MIRIWGGLDWGYKHKGSISIYGMDKDTNIYCLEEYTKDLLLIDSWVLKCKEFITKYGDIPFYSDSAKHLALNSINCWEPLKTLVVEIN